MRHTHPLVSWLLANEAFTHCINLFAFMQIHVTRGRIACNDKLIT